MSDEILKTETVPAEPKVQPKGVPDPRDTPLSASEEEELVSALLKEYHQAIGARTTWLDRQRRFFKKRHGIYPKKTFPWPNAANYHLPLIEKSIRKMKPSFVSLLADAVPVASFMSLDARGMGTEPFIDREFHWLFQQRMDSFEAINVAADWTLSKGFSVAKVFYEKRTHEVTDVYEQADIPEAVLSAVAQGQEDVVRQWLTAIGIPAQSFDEVFAKAWQDLQGAPESLSLTYEVVEYDAPRLEILKPEDLIVSADTTDLDQARFLFHPYLKSAADLRAGVRQGYYRKDVVERIMDHPASPQIGRKSPEASVVTEEEIRRSGMDPDQVPDGLYRLIESYCWKDVNGDGVDERLVVLISEDVPEEPVATYVYKRRRWPFEKIFFESIGFAHTDHRGHAELLDPLQTAMKAQQDQKIDRQTISTALSFKYVPGSVHPGQIRWTPGQGIPVRSMNEFEFVTPPNTDFAFDRQMMELKAWAEETIGNPDFSLAGPLSQTGNDARTAREISAIAQDKQMVLSLDAKVFMNCWRKVFERIWEEWVDFGPREFVVAMLGEPPIPVNRTGVILGEYSIAPAGTLWNSNPQANLAKAMQRLQLFLGNPFVRQYELIADAFIRDDPRLVGRLLVTPQEAQVIQQQMQQAAFQKPGGAAGGGSSGSNGKGNPQAISSVATAS